MKLLTILLASLFLHFNAISTELIYIDYQHRPPFFENNSSTNKIESGILYKLSKKILDKTKINFEFIETPLPRTITKMKEKKERVCISYALFDAARKEFANYSNPYYKEKRNVIVFRNKDKRFKNNKAIKDLLKKEPVSFLVKRGYSYGAYVDDILQKFKSYDRNNNYNNEALFNNLFITYLDNAGMLKQIEMSRADYMLISLTEYEYLENQYNSITKNLSYRFISDMPEGNKRYFLCSKHIEEETIEVINKAIKNTVGKI
jgi:uncharacterized protein (TIGR02285 family)